MSDLTVKQTLFIQEYLKDLNATQAAIRAGYSETSAKVIGCENLTKPDIAEAISKAMDERMAEIKIDANWVLQRLATEVEADLADLYGENGALKPIGEWPKIWRQGLVSGLDVDQEYKWVDGQKEPDGQVMKLKLSDRAKRLEMLGRHVDVQAFVSKLEHTGPNGQPIIVDAAGDMEVARRVAFLLMSGSEHATH